MSLRYSLLIVLLCSVALAQQENTGPNMRKQITSKEQTREVTEMFLKQLVTARPFEAYNLLRPYAIDWDQELDTSRQSTEQLLDQVRNNYGRIVGYEAIETRTLGTSFARYDYLLKFERNALHCRMVYYKARNTWSPIYLNFSEDLGQLFDEVAKIEDNPLNRPPSQR